MQLIRRQPDGQPLRAHLLAAVAAGAAPDARLTHQPPPVATALWHAWLQLASSRPPGMGDPVAVPLSEIDAWQRLNGIEFNPWELDTVIAMDRAAVAVLGSKQGGTP